MVRVPVSSLANSSPAALQVLGVVQHALGDSTMTAVPGSVSVDHALAVAHEDLTPELVFEQRGSAC